MKPDLKCVVLTGLESSGKSSLFNLLTHSATSDESNFRGSSVYCREKRLYKASVRLIDTPGIRYKSDNMTTGLALSALAGSDIVLLVIRATHALAEWETLRPLVKNHSKHRFAVVLTFRDKVTDGMGNIISEFHRLTGAPVIALDVRRAGDTELQQLLELLNHVKTIDTEKVESRSAIPVLNITTLPPQRSWFEAKHLGPLVALLSLILLFALPVWLSWHISNLTQPLADRFLIQPAAMGLKDAPKLLQAVFTGSYGLLSLGIYSFIWAFPVVFFIGLSVAVTDDAGIKERIIYALDPWLRTAGLSGADLVPVLSGFGCNVVAVFQSRTCSHCTRKNCISTIAFGSACSYQIGATLSLFSAAGHPGLFFPYLAILFFTACLHTRLWNRAGLQQQAIAAEEPGWLQWPRWRTVSWMLKNVVTQFLLQAMPLFLIICVAASLLNYFSVIDAICAYLAPLAHAFNLPEPVIPGIIFSLLRKDGLMVLNQDGGTLIQSLSLTQLILVIWLASTLMACLVTILTIAREISWRFAAEVVSKQALSSLLVAALISLTLT